MNFRIKIDCIKEILFSLVFLCTMNHGSSQNNQVQIEIENNEIVGLINFVQAGKESLKAPGSYAVYIYNQLGDNKEFHQIIDDFSLFDFSYSTNDLKYPLNRNYYFWIAASNSNTLEDFSNRIIGYLPHHKHIALIQLLNKARPFYNRVIGSREQKNILRIKSQLANYNSQIGELFFKTSKFYNANWNTDIPFKIILNPIPLERGRTAAIAMGNILICEFLSHKKNDYKARLGVIIHEMCHILQLEQTIETQRQIINWFSKSNSPFAQFAYQFINEALATAIGNGWAYEKIHGEADTESWYSTKYIDGFAHAIFPLVKDYLENGKSIDREFVNESILLFEKTFPKILSETKFLMNEIQLYTNPINEEEEIHIKNMTRKALNIRSMYSYNFFNSKEVKESLKRKNTTKVFIFNASNENESLNLLDKHLSTINIKTSVNSIDVLKNSQLESAIIIIHINDLTKLGSALELLSDKEYLSFGENYKF